MFKNLKQAANELQSIRNDFASGVDALEAKGFDLWDLLDRCDAVGAWLCRNGKTFGLARKLIEEASMLADKIMGGSGKHGVRLVVER